MADRRMLRVPLIALDTDETFFKAQVVWLLSETVGGREITQEITQEIQATDLTVGELAQMNAIIGVFDGVVERLDPLVRV